LRIPPEKTASVELKPPQISGGLSKVHQSRLGLVLYLQFLWFDDGFVETVEPKGQRFQECVLENCGK
jgi:hypothetical protein